MDGIVAGNTFVFDPYAEAGTGGKCLIVNLVSDDDSKYTMSFPPGEDFDRIMDIICMTVGNIKLIRQEGSVIVTLK